MSTCWRRAYVELCREVLSRGTARRAAPSGHVGSLIDLARLFARELSPRLGRSCEVTAALMPEPSDEPSVRINERSTSALSASWPTGRSWDRYATFHIFGDHGSIYG